MKVIDKGSAKPGDPIYNGGLTVSAAKAAYQAHFGTQVPLEAMKVLKVVDLVPILIDALATNTPLAETGWSPMEFGPRGCIIDLAPPTKLPNGKWLN